MLFIKGACSLGGACCSWASGQHEAHWPHGPPQTRSKAGGRTFSVGNRAAREPGRTPARRLWPLLVQIILVPRLRGQEHGTALGLQSQGRAVRRERHSQTCVWKDLMPVAFSGSSSAAGQKFKQETSPLRSLQMRRYKRTV